MSAPAPRHRPKNNEHVEKVLNLWAEGIVGSEIAARLGVTKNVVVGIINRARLVGDERAVIRVPQNSRASILCLPLEERAEYRRRREVERLQRLAERRKEEALARKEAALAKKQGRIMSSFEARRQHQAAMAAVHLAAKEQGKIVPADTAEVISAHQREMAAREAQERTDAEAAERQRQAERREALVENIQRIRSASEAVASRIVPLATVFQPRKPGLCQWIMDGSPLSPAQDVRWCGAETLPGRSWCAAHMRIVFVKARELGEADVPAKEAAA